MTSLAYGDGDLHHPDGSHRTTARTANGSDVERHERRIKAHLEAHAADVQDAEDAADEVIVYLEAHRELPEDGGHGDD